MNRDDREAAVTEAMERLYELTSDQAPSRLAPQLTESLAVRVAKRSEGILRQLYAEGFEHGVSMARGGSQRTRTAPELPDDIPLLDIEDDLEPWSPEDYE